MTDDKVRQSAREFYRALYGHGIESDPEVTSHRLLEFAEAYAAAEKRELREQMSKTHDDVLKLWNDRAEADTRVRKLTEALRRIAEDIFVGSRAEAIAKIRQIAREAVAEAGPMKPGAK